MARFKPTLQKITSLQEVNDALITIAQAEMQIEVIDAEGDKKMQKLKEETAKKGEELRKRIHALSTMIGNYAEYNKDKLFDKKKSIDLSAGTIGYRKSTAISVRKTTVELLKKLGLVQYINIKETPNKDAMRELEDEVLTQVDAVKKENDVFYCEPDREKINQELLSSGN